MKTDIGFTYGTRWEDDAKVLEHYKAMTRRYKRVTVEVRDAS